MLIGRFQRGETVIVLGATMVVSAVRIVLHQIFQEAYFGPQLRYVGFDDEQDGQFQQAVRSNTKRGVCAEDMKEWMTTIEPPMILDTYHAVCWLHRPIRKPH